MARQFKVGETVKFASCGPTYAIRQCEHCKECIADAHTLVEKREKNGSSPYVHGVVTEVERKTKHRGLICHVRVRKTAPKRDKGEISHSVEVPMWLLRPSTKLLAFIPTAKEQAKIVEKNTALNVLSFI